ncbi:MAG: SDR family oxidoreductase [Acidimicrobiia bacterium]|nr:SDR family oxidoreductase [Acidimicrobiia bacterium]
MTSESKPRTAVVTGASSGIGQSVAEELGRLGWRVAVGARRTDRLGDTAARVERAGGQAFTHPLDVTDPQSVETFMVAAEAVLGPVDVLVNNAGMSIPGPFHEISASDHLREVATNYLGALYVTRLAIASMLARHARGDLVFVSSDATRQPRPRMVTYGATKAALEHMARALAMELEGTGIRSTVVRVGPTFTEFGFSWDPEQVEELLGYWLRFGLQRHAGVMEPTSVARAVVVALTTPEGVHLDTVEVQPEAPAELRAAEPLPRPAEAS